jgi:hypothetical protein
MDQFGTIAAVSDGIEAQVKNYGGKLMPLFLSACYGVR